MPQENLVDELEQLIRTKAAQKAEQKVKQEENLIAKS